MNWSDERYVRIYTRDTSDWLALSFDAQSLLMHIIRKADRSGIIELGKHGSRAVAIIIGHPGQWSRLEPALGELLADGCVEIAGDKLLVRNYIEAQEAAQSDRLRKEESRARRRDLARSESSGLLRSVTNRDDGSQNVTKSHERSHAVTSGHSVPSVPSLAVPNQPSLSLVPEGPATEPKKAKAPPLPFTVRDLLQTLSEASRGRIVVEPFDSRLAKSITAVIRECEAQQVTLEDVRIVGEYIATWDAKYDVGPEWVATTGKLLAAVRKARAWHAGGRGSNGAPDKNAWMDR